MASVSRGDFVNRLRGEAMTHKFGITPFPLTVTRTNRLSPRRISIEVPETAEVHSAAQSDNPNLDGTGDSPSTEGADK
jgi:hypothetical protein